MPINCSNRYTQAGGYKVGADARITLPEESLAAVAKASGNEVGGGARTSISAWIIVL